MTMIFGLDKAISPVAGKVLGSIFDGRTLAVTLAPSVAFWSAAGALAGSQLGWDSVRHWWNQLDTGMRIVFAVLAVAGLVLFALFLAAAEAKILTFYEGYWRFDGVRKLGTWMQARALAKLDIDNNSAHFERAYYWFPAVQGADGLMPTRLGNALRAAEMYPFSEGRYGLDAVFWWPRLSAVIPDSFRADLASARASIALLVSASALSIVLSVSALVTAVILCAAGVTVVGGFWLVAVAAAFVSVIAYRAALQPTLTYANLLRASFDLYREDLLTRLGFALPETLAKERQLWSGLQEILYREGTSEANELAVDQARTNYIARKAK